MLEKYLAPLFDNLVPLYGSTMAALLGTRAPSPLIVQLDLTYRCNLGCRMCFQKESRKNIGRELTAAQIAQIVSQLPQRTVITLSGGEPFVRKDIIEILDNVLDAHPVNMITNGTAVPDEAIELMVRKGMLLVGVSIDGIVATHDAIRGREGAFDLTTGFIRRLSEAKKAAGRKRPLIDIKTVIMKDNMSELPALHALTQELGADYHTLSVQFGTCRTYTDAEIEALRGSIAAIRERRSNTQLRFYPAGVEGNNLRPFMSGEIGPGDCKACRYAWMNMHIDPYGTIYPCQPFFTVPMNGERISVKDIWNGTQYRTFRKRMKQEGLMEPCMRSCCYFRLRG